MSHELSAKLIVILVCSLLLAFVLVVYVPNKLQRTTSTIRHLPQQPFLFGLDILYQNFRDLRRHNSLNRSLSRHNAYGQTYFSAALGQSTIHTIDPANILAVTTDNFIDYEKGKWAQTIAKYMGKGVLVNDGVEWHASRALLKPLFRRNRAVDVGILELHGNHLLDHLKSQEGSFVDFRRAAQMVVLDITTEMLTGESTMSLRSSVSKSSQKDKRGSGHSLRGPALLDLIDELEPYGNTAIELGPFALLIFASKYCKIVALIKGIQEFFKTAVGNVRGRQYHDKSSDNISIIEEMLFQGLKPHQVQGELQNIFFAAFDTTTALLSNLFDCLARHTSIIKRLKEELGLVIGSRPLLANDIPRLIYLRAAIFETLRLHSPVTYHTRRAGTNTLLPRGGGHDGKSPVFVRQGTSVTWSTYALNRQVGIYGEDSAEFRPERWLTSDCLVSGEVPVLQTKESFMPFGSGPRNCLGQQIAMLQTMYIAARVLGTFESFQLRDGDASFLEATAITHYNGRGTWIKFNENKRVRANY